MFSMDPGPSHGWLWKCTKKKEIYVDGEKGVVKNKQKQRLPFTGVCVCVGGGSNIRSGGDRWLVFTTTAEAVCETVRRQVFLRLSRYVGGGSGHRKGRTASCHPPTRCRRWLGEGGSRRGGSWAAAATPRPSGCHPRSRCRGQCRSGSAPGS